MPISLTYLFSFAIVAYFDYTGYSLITSNGGCDHVDGGVPTYCLHSKPQTECQASCTSHDTCIAYVFHFSESPRNCALIISGITCPNNYKFYNFTTAKSVDDLVANSNPDEACYAKNLGGSKTIYIMVIQGN